ncbi:MAG: sigma 54-interacting transcriptional regulator [Deltaproteobacteria bacterium]|nr:sigma 54-interacting transcriptional regulator [Deltaproteobacteria bacterium]
MMEGVVVLGRYRLTEPLGQGRQGAVWAAEDLRTPGASVAVKFAHADVVQSELEALARLSHRGLARVLAVGRHQEGGVLVLERVSGEALSAILRARSLTLREHVRVVFDTADALSAVHAAGLIHGDVKPENLVLQPQQTSLVDFGLSRVQASAAQLPSGTLAFLPPEALIGVHSAAQDLYALGVTAALALVRTHPFVSASVAQEGWLAARLAQRAPLGHVIDAIDPLMRPLILRLLAWSPDLRGTADAVLTTLAREVPQWLSVAQRKRAAAVGTAPRMAPAWAGAEETLEGACHALCDALADNGLGVVVRGAKASGKTRFLHEIVNQTRIVFASRGHTVRVVTSLPLDLIEPTVVLLDQHAPEQIARVAEGLRQLRALGGIAEPIALLASTDSTDVTDATHSTHSTHSTGAFGEGLIELALQPLDRARHDELLERALGGCVEPDVGAALYAASGGLAGRCVRLLQGLADGAASAVTLDDVRQAQRALGDPLAVCKRLPTGSRALMFALLVAGEALGVGVIESLDPEWREHSAALLREGLVSLANESLCATHSLTLSEAIDVRAPRFAQSARALKRALDARGGLSWTLRMRVTALAGDHAEALALATQGLVDPSQNAETLHELLAMRAALLPHDVGAQQSWARSLLWRGQAKHARHVLDALSDRADDLLLQVDVLRALGDNAGVEGVLEVLGRDATHPSRVAVAALQARVHLESGALTDALERLRQDAPTEACPSVIRLRWIEVMATVLVQQGHADQALVVLDQVPSHERHGDVRAMGRLWSLHGMCHQSQGNLDLALACYEHGWVSARAAGDLRVASTLAVNRGTAQWQRGQLGEACTWLARGVRGLAAWGSRFELARAIANAATLALFVGDLEGARDALGRGQRAAEQAGDPESLRLLSVLSASATPDVAESVARLRDLSEKTTDPHAKGLAEELNARAICLAAEHGMLWPSASLPEPLHEPIAAIAALALAVVREAPTETVRALAALAREQVRAANEPELTLLLSRWQTRLPANNQEKRRLHATYESDVQALAATLSPPMEKVFRAHHALLSSAKTSANWAVRGALSSEPVAALRWRRLVEITREINGEMRLRPLLERVMDAVVELTGGARGFLLLSGPDGSQRVRTARNMGGRELAPGEGSPSRSIADRVAKTGEAIVTIDAANDQRLTAFESVAAMQLRSVLAVPLVIHGVSSGTVYVDDQLRPGAFSDDAIQVASEFAEIAAVAIHNARSAAKLRRALRKSERLARALATRVQTQDVELEATRRALSSEHEPSGRYDAIVGRGAAMKKLLSLCDRVASTGVSVLLLGESGTGKELIARALHHNSPRAKRPFVAINCAAVTETLLESELFGHLRGAFTGADRARQGLFEVADGGTLFLDEVGEMSAGMQSRLLRVLQDGEVRPVGGTLSRKVDVRVIAATLRDLPKLVESGQFREDLYYRLAVLTVELPPLRARGEDIPTLVSHLLHKHQRAEIKVDRRAMQRLVNYRWPGNIRQLENELLRASLLCDGVIRESDLDPRLLQTITEPRESDVTMDLRTAVEDIERRVAQRALSRFHGNQTKAAQAMGLSRFGLQKLLKRLGMDDAARLARDASA